MKKDIIPEILEDEREMFPVDPRILVRRAPSRDFVAGLERGVTLVFTRVGVETRIGSHTTAPRAREETATPRIPFPLTNVAESSCSNFLAGCGGRGRAPRDARGDPRERDVARRDDAAARCARRGECRVSRRGGFRKRARPRALRHHLLPRAEVRATPPNLVSHFSKARSRHERSRVSESAHNTNSADQRLPLLDRRASLRQVYHICETQGRIALKRTSPPRFFRLALSRRPSWHPPLASSPRSAVRCFSSSRQPKSRKNPGSQPRFGRFADAPRAPSSSFGRRRRLAAPDRERALEESDPPRAVHVSPVHACGGGRGRLARLQPRRTRARDHHRARLPRRRAQGGLREAARQTAQTQARLGGFRFSARARAVHRRRDRAKVRALGEEGSGFCCRASGSAPGSRLAPPAARRAGRARRVGVRGKPREAGCARPRRRRARRRRERERRRRVRFASQGGILFQGRGDVAAAPPTVRDGGRERATLGGSGAGERLAGGRDFPAVRLEGHVTRGVSRSCDRYRRGRAAREGRSGREGSESGGGEASARVPAARRPAARRRARAGDGRRHGGGSRCARPQREPSQARFWETCRAPARGRADVAAETRRAARVKHAQPPVGDGDASLTTRLYQFSSSRAYRGDASGDVVWEGS